MKNLDEIAYDAICNWPKVIDFNPVHKGIDYSLIIRFYLWDKVGRAIRIENNIDFGELEVYKTEYKNFPQYYQPLISNGTFKKSIFNRKKIIFIPFQAPHTVQLVEALKKQQEYIVIAKYNSSQFTNAYTIKSPSYKDDLNWSDRLYEAILSAFKQLKIEFIDEDKDLLKVQVKGVVQMALLAEKELAKYKPNAVYVHSDNHPPFINYILAAKKLGIPTFTYQHGLDCEHYFLDDCFADYIAVWGMDRKQKYLLNSKFQPKAIKEIGNVFINSEEFKVTSGTKNTILLVTRPHSPIKCYSPTRNILEGKFILEAILEYLKINLDTKLIIKAHPLDAVNFYLESVNTFNLNDRVEIVNETVQELFSKVNVVVTEDSTAGAEALFFNLPMVHAHFANSKPVLPFIEYNCALKGFTKAELIHNLDKAINMSSLELREMTINNKTFINDFIPLGNVEELANFIFKNI